MKEQHDLIEMKIPAKAEYIGVIRLTVSGLASRVGFSYDDIEDLKVAVSEAATNAVNHAYSDGEEGEVALAFSIYEDRLEIVVADNGKSFDAEEARLRLGPYDGSKPIATLTEGGLGLFLIDTLMDEVQISNSAGVVVRMTKYLQRDGVDHHVGTPTSPIK